MNLLFPVDTAPVFAPEEGTAAPERLVEGAPSFKTWQLDTALAEAARWGQIRTGVWEATVGKTISIKGGNLRVLPHPFGPLRNRRGCRRELTSSARATALS